MLNKVHSLLLILFSLILLSSCAKEETLSITAGTDLLERSELDGVIMDQMGVKDLFYWANVDDRFVWSAAMQSDSLLSVGYCVNGDKEINDRIHLLDFSESDWRSAKSELIELVLAEERKSRGIDDLNALDLMPRHLNGDKWPNFFIQVTCLESVKILREHMNVRYVEPPGYHLQEPSQRSDSGCSNEPNYGIDANDYSTVNPESKVPWNYYHHRINLAWTKSTGKRTRIGVIDTGISSDQDNLDGNYNSGYSQGRSVQRLSTKWSGALWWASLDGPEDDCGHGTSMSGVATGPRSDDGNSVGVAYGANLLSVRGVEDVVITTSNESAGVRDALGIMGDRTDVKIVSMSIGDPFYNSTVADGIYYSYNHGDIILCAAGTSFSLTTWYGVVFPATMSETLAVTGVKETGFSACESCHDGSEVDYVVTMERDGNSNRHPLSLAMYSDQPSYIGGSSVATSTMAGITSLVWSAFPADNRAQILNRLKYASQLYPNRHPDFGWGRVDAAEAVQFNVLDAQDL